MIENYPKYKKKVYEFIKEREEDFFELDNSQKCIVIFEMIRVMKRGEQYINIPFEPYNLKNDRKGRLTWTIYFLFIMIKNVDISILSADYILVDFAFWHTFDIFCFENIVYSI